MAESHSDDAQNYYRLGDTYYFGKNVLRDYDKARQEYERAAALGHAEAQYSLGVMCHSGKGVPQDYDKARQWYEKAAAQGHEEAQKALNALKS